MSLHTHPEVPDGIVPAPKPDARPKGDLAPVPLWAPLAALIVAFFAAAVSGLVILAIIEAGGGNVADNTPGLIIPATLIQDAALIGAALLFSAIYARGLTPASFGLRPTRLWPAVGWTLLAWGAFLALTAIYVNIVGQPDQQELTRDLKDESSTVALIGYAVLLAFVAPLCEEFFFRGFMFGVLREKLGVVGGTILTGIVFGLVHVAGSPLETVGVLVILGMLLCVLYWRTGSLLPCIALHAINNAISFSATKGLSVPGAIAIVLATSGAAVAVGAAVMQRSPALPGAPQTPR